MVTTSPEIPQGSMEIKMWGTQTKMRSEVNMMNQQITSIVDFDQKVMYNIMPAQGLAMKMKFDPNQVPGLNLDELYTKYDDVPHEKVGEEEVNGVMCSVYEVRREDSDGVDKLWIDESNKFVMKASIPSQQMTMEWKDVSFEPVDDAMFQPDPSLQIMDLSQMGGEGGLDPSMLQKMMPGN
jgi:negative regulator of sigma E activity